jgi:hypothetical protein
MFEKGSPIYVIHFFICLIIIFIAAWIYYYDSPTIVFGNIIFCFYFKALIDAKKIKDLQNSVKDLQNSINEKCVKKKN